jgi:hypothetical protein
MWKAELGIGVSQLSVIVQNTRENQLMKKESLFWLTELEFIIHDWLALLLSVSGGDMWQSKTAHHMAGRQKRGLE